MGFLRKFNKAKFDYYTAYATEAIIKYEKYNNKGDVDMADYWFDEACKACGKAFKYLNRGIN